ncbi:MAG: prolipoprotein diacylglyceryl transferase [Oscillospiraceae bacterium]|nr:prolipoprotein diacylglyceryl transferase [Oscillospiraceae bacterium]
MLPYINLFGVDIPMYAVLSAAGAAAITVFCVLQCRFCKKTPQIKTYDVFYMLLYAFIGAIIGAKLLYLLTSVEVYWLPQLSFWDNMRYWLLLIAGGGLVFYGGLIGALLGALRYVLHFKAPVSTMLDSAFVGVPLFHAFGRVGCFLAGCCFGTEYHGILAVTFPEGNLGKAPAGAELLPVQLIEAFLNIVLWAILFTVYRRTSRRWLTSGLYLACYGVMRFVLEYFRGDVIRGSIFSLSTSQFISIFIVAAGVLLLIDPKWLDDFGGKNDSIYKEQLEKAERTAQ